MSHVRRTPTRLGPSEPSRAAAARSKKIEKCTYFFKKKTRAKKLSDFRKSMPHGDSNPGHPRPQGCSLH